MKRAVWSVLLGVLLWTNSCGADESAPGIEPIGEQQDAMEPAGDALVSDTGAAGDSQAQCQINCGGRECGDNGCGGSCGACGAGTNCHDGQCVMGCDSPTCSLGIGCVFADGTPALCGGTITFDADLDGQLLDDNVNIETTFAAAGVYLFTPSEDTVVATNHWELNSTSGMNSCATLDKFQQPWREPVFIRFAKPNGASALQAATHYVSLYVGDTWPGGLAVDYYAPGPAPRTPAVTPFHTEMTDGNGTNFVEFGSGNPIGYIVVHAAADPDFTIDDLTFGPLYVP